MSSITGAKPIAYNQLDYVNGLQLSFSSTNPDEVVGVATGTCMDSTRTFQIVVETALTASNVLAGAGGLDTGTVAASTQYFIHLIQGLLKPTNQALMYSLSATAPTMPLGYEIFRCLGCIRTASDSDNLPGYWSGNGSYRTFMFDSPLATTITAGASTTDAEVPLSGLVPAIYLNMPVWMYVVATGDAASRLLTVKPYGGTGYPITVTTQVTSVAITPTFRVQSRLNSTVPSLQYKWGAGTNTAAFSVAGYEYYI